MAGRCCTCCRRFAGRAIESPVEQRRIGGHAAHAVGRLIRGRSAGQWRTCADTRPAPGLRRCQPRGACGAGWRHRCGSAQPGAHPPAAVPGVAFLCHAPGTGRVAPGFRPGRPVTQRGRTRPCPRQHQRAQPRVAGHRGWRGQGRIAAHQGRIGPAPAHRR